MQRHNLSSCFFVLIFAMSHLVTANTSASPSPSVRVNTGTLTGIRLEDQNEVAFLGIPFAPPPVGPLR
jgi:Carboxylesterase family